MRVLCLTFGDATQASTFYRIHQYIPLLAKKGIQVEPIPARAFEAWDTLSRYDCVLLQKALLPRAKLRRLRSDSRRLLYDVDDAIWHPHDKKHFFLTNLRQNLRLKFIARSADHCIAANSVLADHLKSLTPKVSVLPMALDELTWTPRVAPTSQDHIRIGWSGHPVNLRYLEQIESALLEIQSRFPAVEFVVFSGQKPNFEKLKCTHIPYASGAEAEVIRTFDIGLLPLPGDDFSAAKSPIKGLQYMACSIPTVLTPVGAAAQIFTDQETALFARNPSAWQSALARLISEPSLRAQLGSQARRVFETTYTLSRAAAQFATILKG